MSSNWIGSAEFARPTKLQPFHIRYLPKKATELASKASSLGYLGLYEVSALQRAEYRQAVDAATPSQFSSLALLKATAAGRWIHLWEK
jgi:hypothetical protein